MANHLRTEQFKQYMPPNVIMQYLNWPSVFGTTIATLCTGKKKQGGEFAPNADIRLDKSFRLLSYLIDETIDKERNPPERGK